MVGGEDSMGAGAREEGKKEGLREEG